MPAMRSAQGREEMEAAREEGVSFMPGWGPRRVLVENGHVAGLELVRCVRMYDDAGRFRPQFDEQDRTIVSDRKRHPGDRASARIVVCNPGRWRLRLRRPAPCASIR